MNLKQSLFHWKSQVNSLYNLFVSIWFDIGAIRAKKFLFQQTIVILKILYRWCDGYFKLIFTGPVPLLKMEISRLEEENSKLRSRLENIEMDCSNILQEKGTLQEQVSKLKKQISSSSSAPNVQISNLQSEVPKLSINFTECSLPNMWLSN